MLSTMLTEANDVPGSFLKRFIPRRYAEPLISKQFADAFRGTKIEVRTMIVLQGKVSRVSCILDLMLTPSTSKACLRF